LKSVSFRPYQSAQDLEGMARVHEESASADHIDADSTLEGVPTAKDLENKLNDKHRVPAI
jgi:hypothetical protein